MQYGFYVGEKGKYLAVNTDNSLKTGEIQTEV